MATDVIRCQDFLRRRFGISSLNSSNPNRRSGSSRSLRRKRSPAQYDRLSNRERLSSVANFQSKGLVMGQVRILKRGNELEPKIDGEDLVYTADSLGPDPEVVVKHIRFSDLYAGSAAFLPSPPPSSLPFPALLVRSGTATTDLRRMLKI
ncbi:hypothetical protein Nepgr_006449 [Nepenthes gracilis]|uniref:Uncharacterized protein n=1 Tax=Nepenthes gracilis TaxID=150966 RepID=A0AAD3S512_NEPGR|nr:hypothetical protein Nepgr_006449 [Nepenthes gracilis]